MNVAKLIDQQRRTELTEPSSAEQHFLELCEHLYHPKPAQMNWKEGFFRFERGVPRQEVPKISVQDLGGPRNGEFLRVFFRVPSVVYTRPHLRSRHRRAG